MSSLETAFDTIVREYPPHMRASLVLPLLHAVQEHKGYIEDADAHLVASYAGVPPMQVMEALSWYSMFAREPRGRHVIKICRNIGCSLRGAERLIAHLERTLGIKAGETTSDGRFTLQTVECLASCGSAPSMQVDDTHHDRLTEASIDRILRALA